LQTEKLQGVGGKAGGRGRVSLVYPQFLTQINENVEIILHSGAREAVKDINSVKGASW
jgi:hypothetical protein